ncbi:Holliday junction ATP-dependent DNA helicase RuvA, partial [Vibrio parahaemolyticus]|nr:Holliday junction ATP-dependent DNA helicase RuvA [Vibrio parahaemolyticus]NMR88577.1 Holliday junction branch migration protein RuvA [Vibrio parahaemolyticus]
KLLISVSKVGPKLACSILSSISTFRLKQAIVSNDVMQLCECPGVGKKTAERIILELKDKIDLSSIYNNFEKEENSANISKIEEVIEACTSLGYNKYEIKKVLDEIDIQNLEIEEIIKQILRKLSNR